MGREVARKLFIELLDDLIARLALEIERASLNRRLDELDFHMSPFW
jgi:hypothetical protein